jgi:hypothetical protein
MIFQGMSMRLLQAQQQSPRMPSEELKTRFGEPVVAPDLPDIFHRVELE